MALLAAVKPLVFDTLDPDLFWHLLVGNQLIREGIHPLIDPISYASIRTPWTPYSWLAELLMRWLWQFDGYRATLAAHCLLMAAMVITVATLALQAVPRSVSKTCAAAAVATATSVVFIVPWFSYRPAAFAMLVLAGIALLLQRDRRLDERSRLIWCIIPLTALAANLHLFVLLAPLWVAGLLCGAIWEYLRRDAATGAEQRRRIQRYSLMLVAVALASCATPMLPGMLKTAVFYMHSDVLVASDVIVEMQPFYRGRFGLVAAVLAALLALVILAKARHVRAGEWLWAATGAVALMQHGRGAPLFALCIVPAVTLAAQMNSDRRLMAKNLTWVLVAIAAAELATIAWVFPGRGVSLNQWLNRQNPAAYPTRAAEHVLKTVAPISGRVINEFTWGGYLAWRLDGRFQVLMDGRTQLYTREFWQAAYLDGWDPRRKLLAETHADAAILPTDGSLFQEELLQLGWRETYRDSTAIVLLPPIGPLRP